MSKMCDLTEKSLIQCEDVCRDFLRNVCNRGNKCRFKHPTKGPQNTSVFLNPTEEKINFCKTICHDFQNTGCLREGCKFIHCSKQDQDIFMESGNLPTFIVEDAIAKAVIPSIPGEAPVCRDYLSGECRRGKSCRFRHLSLCKYRKELDILFGYQTASTEFCGPPEKRFKTCIPCPNFTYQQVCQTSMGHNSFSKCSHNGYIQNVTQHPSNCSISGFTPGKCCELSHDSQNKHTNESLCLEENSILKKQIFELRRQVADLMTANEFLLEQNATLRLLRKNGGMVALQSTGGAALNMQTAPGQQLVTSAVPVSIAVTGPGSQMTLSSMAMTGQTSTQQLLPVSCHAPGQQIMTAVNTVTVAGQAGSAALLATAVPVSVSSSANQLVPVSAVPVSLATVSMAPVHIPPIVTAASEPPHSIAMSASAATSLVSYPIMTQPLLQTR